MNFMYKYVKLNREIYFDTLFSIYNIFISSNISYGFLLMNKTRIFSVEKPNGFQYYFVAIHSFCLIIISKTVVQIVTSESKRKIILLSKSTYKQL